MTSEEFEHMAIGLRPQLLHIAMNFCHDEDDAEDIITKAKKWEATFEYDSKEDLYRLISTKPIK